MQVNEKLIDTLVMPGDVITLSTKSSQEIGRKPIRIGQGIAANGPQLVSQKFGVLRYLSAQNKYFVESAQQTVYNQLAQDDMVIGVIKERAGENYKVEINAPHTATLNLTSFDGATKRNRPDLKPGSLVYARVSTVNRDLDPEITCVSSNAAMRKDWVTGLSTFGELKDGYMIQVGCDVCRSLLQPDNELLKQLGERVPFEIAVGLNGRVWVCAMDQPAPSSLMPSTTPSTIDASRAVDAHVKDTILIANAIQNIQYLSNAQQIKQLLDRLFSAPQTPAKSAVAGRKKKK